MLASMSAFQAGSASKQPGEEANFLTLFLESLGAPEGRLRMWGVLHGDRGTAACVLAFTSPQASLALFAQSPGLSMVHSLHCSTLQQARWTWLGLQGLLQLLESGKCKGGWTGTLEKQHGHTDKHRSLVYTEPPPFVSKYADLQMAFPAFGNS